MVISSETVDAVIRSQTAPRQQSGFGKIIITDKAAWLQTSGERIPVELPPNSNLGNGTAVRYEISGNIISITQAGAQKDAIRPSATDAFNPPQNAVSTTAAAPLRTGPLTVAASIPAGLYIFTNADEAAAFIGYKGNDDVVRQLQRLIDEGGAAAVRIDTLTASESRVFLLKLPEIVLTLQTLQASFLSAGLSSMPVDILRQVLFDRGNLPFSPLIALDQALAAAGMPLPTSRAGSAEAQKFALAQWLHAALSNHKLPQLIAPLIPATPASAMVSDLTPLLPSFSGATGGMQPLPEDFGLTQQSIGRASLAIDPIASAAQRMGFTFEHALGAPSADTDTVPPDRTLKALLLRFSALLPTFDSIMTKTLPEPVTGSMPEGVSDLPPAPAILTHVNQSLLAERLNDLHRTLLATAQSLLPRPGELPPEKSGAMPKMYSSITPSLLATAVSVAPDPVSATLLKSIAEKITSSVSLLKEPSLHLTTLADRPVQSATLSPEQKITSMLSRLTELADLLQHAASLKIALPAATQTIPLIRTALDSIAALIRLLEPVPENGTAPAGISGNDRARTDISQPLDRTTQPMPTTLQQSILSRAVDSALDRLESLQLLARQTPTAQGTQQIIALPIKFGDHWTEINVRFLHHRQRKSPKNKPHYSVDINVAPAALGAIRAHLDYRAPSQLQFNADFERSSTRDWFVNHREELRAALSRGGATSVSVEFRQIRKKTALSMAASRNAPGAIDMRG